MVILYVNLTRVRDAQIASKTLFLSVSVKMFLEDISINTAELSKADCLPQRGWAASSPLR